MGEKALLPGHTCLMKTGEATAQVTIAAPRHAIDINTMDHLPARTLGLNEIGLCNLHLDRPVAFAP